MKGISIDKIFSLSINKEYFDKLTEIINSVPEMLKNISQLEKYYVDKIEKVKNLGWTMSELLMEEEIIEKDENMTDEYIHQFYKSNHYHQLFKEFESIKNNCGEAFDDTLDMIIEVLEVDMKYYPLCVGVLFSIVDHSFVYQLEDGQMDNSKFINKKTQEEFSGKINNDKTVLLKKIRLTCCELIKEKYFKSVSFSDNKLTRHSVHHGRYDVTQITEKEFIRLVNFCSTFSEFNNKPDKQCLIL
ncbi:hypothetical protein BH747_00275 [Enterococcus villorum]|uniref:Uncharacterized protein n=1 Tax=Enterococcus villorum TaxID=112904 RepID=A0A1V8YGF0_9ENTE|nr:hypothetical protein [Enterococcus villorum]OQO71304.1 hypothetical protein BH747_00275 [Enterococcus villorum]OQO71707.1 hypothetical protein BH744_13945 [Enterococcus villorum]